jgi:hypothetical protein
MSDEVDKVLSKTPTLERALGRFPTIIIVLFALWTVRPRGGSTRVLIACWLIVAGWFKLRT